MTLLIRYWCRIPSLNVSVAFLTSNRTFLTARSTQLWRAPRFACWWAPILNVFENRGVQGPITTDPDVSPNRPLSSEAILGWRVFLGVDQAGDRECADAPRTRSYAKNLSFFSYQSQTFEHFSLDRFSPITHLPACRCNFIRNSSASWCCSHPQSPWCSRSLFYADFSPNLSFYPESHLILAWLALCETFYSSSSEWSFWLLYDLSHNSPSLVSTNQIRPSL